MTDLMRYASQLADVGSLPERPVDAWDPQFCGTLDLIIKADGTWLYGGTPIGRARLVQLFASVLKREGDDYFLVTPVEKLAIEVEDAPFIATQVDVSDLGVPSQAITFSTNMGDRITADHGHEIVSSLRAEDPAGPPYVHVRRGLFAKIARPPYYQLMDIVGPRPESIESAENNAYASNLIDHDKDYLGLWSRGVFFPLFEPGQSEYLGT
ncbi:MAG: DUF1285 domain-containing protein [Pseudomonadota bacterium]